MKFKDRAEAGLRLAEKLKKFKGHEDVRLFALPRGGVETAAAIAKELGIPFDVIVTRKVGSPMNKEYALGALAETGETIWNDQTERDEQPKKALDEIIRNEQKEAERRVEIFRGGRPLPDLKGMTVIIVDDGIATGASVRAGVAAAEHQGAKKVMVAVPHGAKETVDLMRMDGIEVITLDEPFIYSAVGSFYEEFHQMKDDEVKILINRYGPNGTEWKKK
jgi:putative phosphoribosyl transferase